MLQLLLFLGRDLGTTGTILAELLFGMIADTWAGNNSKFLLLIDSCYIYPCVCLCNHAEADQDQCFWAILHRKTCPLYLGFLILKLIHDVYRLVIDYLPHK